MTHQVSARDPQPSKHRLVRVLLTALLVSPVWSSWATADDPPPAEMSVSEAIDYFVDVKLRQAGVTPAPLVDDANLLRRTTLDLAGRVGTVAETKAYLASRDSDKRRQLVARLVQSQEFVRHQANEFDTLLMHGSGGSLRDYLLRAMDENRGWDRMFREMMLGEEGDSQQTGAIGFVKARAKDIDRLVNDTSVKFFGVNVSCTKCHDHPLVPAWSQDHFFGMKSFFARTFDNGGMLGEREYGIVKFQTTDGDQRTAKLMFLTGTVIDEPESTEPTDDEKRDEKRLLAELKEKKLPPPPPSFSRRAQLVEVALNGQQPSFFARAIVNHVWRRLLGRGLVMPVDQMHQENLPSHPVLLDWLERDFADHGYDLRRLIEGIVMSRTYARSSRWEQQGSRPAADLFAVAPLRPLTPRQYAMTLWMASTDADVLDGEAASGGWEQRIADLEESTDDLAALFAQPGEHFQVGVDEALLLSNAEQIRDQMLSFAEHSLLTKLTSMDDRRQLIETAVWNVFVRPPRDEEIRLLEDYLDRRRDRPVEACRQMIWSLMCSGECRFNY